MAFAGQKEEKRMNRTVRTVGVALVALFLIAMPALASTPTSQHKAVGVQGIVWILSLGIAGAVAYKTPGSATTAPTAQQAHFQSLQVAEVTFADADTTFPVTHNLAAQTGTFTPNTGQDLPKVTLTVKTPGTAFPGISAAWTDANTVTINKANTTFGSGCVVVVYIETPNSLVGAQGA